MSDKTLDDKNIEKEIPVEVKEEKKAPSSQEKTEKTVEELTAELAKAKAIQEDKHNFALKTESELKKYKEKEEEQRIANLEKKGEYEELISETKQFRESSQAKQTELENQIEEIKAENQKFIDDATNEVVNTIPEEKRGIANSLTEGYTGKQKVEKLKEFAAALGGKSGGFGGPINAEKSKKPSSDFESLRERIVSGETLTGPEMTQYKKLKAENNNK